MKKMNSEFIKQKPQQNNAKTVKMAKRGRPVTVDRSYCEDPYVQKWFVGLDKNTKGNYSRQFKEWLDFIGMNPTEQIELRIMQTNSNDLTERQFFENKWREFKAYLEATKKTDSCVKGYLKCVASFFSRNFGKRYGLALVRGDWVSTLPQHMKALDWIPSQAEIKTLYTHANLRNKALLLTLYHTGLSEADTTELTIESIKELYTSEETEHIYFQKYRTKTTELTASCFSFEVIHDIREMLSERGNPKKGFIFVNPSTNKPLTTHGIQVALKELVAKTFGEEKAKEFETRHLRDAYNSALISSGIVGDIKCLMMGHNIKGSEGKYAFNPEDIKKAYDKLFPHVSVNGLQSRHDIVVLKNHKREQAEKIAQLKDTLLAVETENHVLKTRIELLQKNFGVTEDALASLLKPLIREMLREKLLEPSKTTDVGFLIAPKIPNIDAMSSAGIIELYTKLKRGEPLSSIASPDLFESLKQKSE